MLGIDDIPGGDVLPPGVGPPAVDVPAKGTAPVVEETPLNSADDLGTASTGLSVGQASVMIGQSLPPGTAMVTGEGTPYQGVFYPWIPPVRPDAVPLPGMLAFDLHQLGVITLSAMAAEGLDHRDSVVQIFLEDACHILPTLQQLLDDLYRPDSSGGGVTGSLDLLKAVMFPRVSDVI